MPKIVLLMSRDLPKEMGNILRYTFLVAIEFI